MAYRTYKAHVIVLKKTKLGEKDLIVTMLDESGTLVQGVAKGARRPGGSFAARLELFSTVDVLMARGRSLDVVCEARLTGAPASSATPEQSVCAFPLAELLGLVAQPGLSQPRLFPMAQAAFAHIAALADEPHRMLSIASAGLWKTISQVGYRPSIASCALCARPVDLDAEGGAVAFSVAEGGVVCARCARPADSISVDAQTLLGCEALITTRYDGVTSLGMDSPSCMATLRLAQLWIHTHTGWALRSLDFLFASGLFR